MTTDEDQIIKCADCATEFVFTAGEQAFFASKGLTHAPTRCRGCRDARRGHRPEAAPEGGARPGRGGRPAGGTREMYEAVCDACGAKTEVPFLPTSGRPIYCRDCFRSRRPQPGRAAGAPVARPAASARGPRGQGAVKWFNEAKGFGFIQADDGEELFVHFSAILDGGAHPLTEGDRVEFDVVEGAKGKQAANVSRL